MWRPEGWKNPYDVSIGGDALRVAYLESNLSGYKVGFEQGADAMLKALFKLAKESPTKTFTIDSRGITIYEETQNEGK